jgi:signal transduction histidine kinase
MFLGDRPVGSLVVIRRPRDGSTPSAFDRLRLMRLRVVANYLTIALQSISLETEQKRRVRELLLLNEVARDCAKLGLDQLLPAVSERLCRSLAVDATGMFFLDQEHDELVWGGGYSRFGALPSSRTRFSVQSSGLAAKALKTRQARRASLDEVEVPALQEYCNRFGLHYFAGIPLLVKDRVLGVIAAAGRERALTDEELRLLVAIGAEFAVAVENALLYSEARHRAEDLSLVQNIGESMARSLDPSSVVHDAGMRLYEALECDCVRLFTRVDATFTSFWQHGMPEAYASRSAIRTVDEPLAARALSSSSAVAFAANDLPEPSLSFYAELGYQQLMVAPLLVAEELAGTQKVANTGFVAVARRASRPFTSSEQHVLGAVATQLAVALKNARLFEQTKQRAEELSIIAETGRALLGGTSLAEALSVVVERIARLVNVRGCHLMLVDTAAENLRFVATYPVQRELENMRVSLHSEAMAARAVREKVPKTDRDLLHHPRAHTWPNLPFQPRWAMSIPLISGEQVVGVLLIVESDLERELSQAELDRVMAVGNQIAIAIERSRLHVRLEEAQAQLVRKERLAALGQLAAHVAHEVRNPLGVIVNSLGTLARFVDLSGDSLRVYEMMKQEAGRLDRIVTDMLDYTRPTEPRLVPASLGRVLKDALASATASERARNPAVDNIQTMLEVDADLPSVPMDDRLLHQALVNLLSNAFQSLGRSGKVTFRGRLSDDRHYAEICVEDNGPGITAENKGRLFEPFFTTKAKGSGLGLAIVKRIVDDHNGEIIVDTEPGRGTRFIIRLPATAVLSSAVTQRRTNLSA